MALPVVRQKPVTIARPKRGRHGVFSELGHDDGGLDEIKQSLFSEASTWSHASWISAVSSPLTRSLGPFDPEETAELELAPKGWAREIKTVDHRTHDTNDVKRLRTDEQELAEAKRALRAVKPGDWHAQAFVHHKKKLKDEGRWLALPGLVDLVRKTSDEALKAGSYCLPSNKMAQVRLSQKPTVKWVTMDDCVEPDPFSGPAVPPLVVSEKTPLEAAGALGQQFKGHPVIVTLEASEFERNGEKKGHLLQGEARGVAQHEMFVCSNFVFSNRAATHLCAKARQSPQERLCDFHDPAVVVADDVMLFRGPAENGYPFLSQEEQLPMKVLVTGRAVKRPWLQKGELFLNQDDFLAFSHRLNLMTFQALEELVGPMPATPGPAPVLVLSASGLAEPEHRQPRGGIAQALKTWRTMWSGYFEAVVVACGDRETAGIIDRMVNTDVYMKVLQNQAVSPKASEWHWKLELMQLSYNPVFANIARRMAVVREAAVVSSSASLRAPDAPRKSGRRSSGAGIMFLTEAMSEHQRPAGAVLQSSASRLSLVDPSEPGESVSFASLSRSVMIGRALTSASNAGDNEPPSRDPSTMTRGGSMLMTSAITTGGRPGAGRRASLAVGKDGLPEDSRTQMERIAKLRLEHTDHEQQLKDEEDRRNQAKMAEVLAKAWGVAGKTMSGIVSKVEKKDDKDKKKLHGRLGNKEAEREAQEEKKAKLETMTLDKKRQIDSNAAVLGCPVDLRNYIFKQIEKEIKMNNNAAKEQDEEDGLEDLEGATDAASLLKDKDVPGTEEVAAVFEEVRLLAESLEKMLEPRWKDLHGGSYSARTPRKSPGAAGAGALPAIRR